jgi:hypothetical protein
MQSDQVSRALGQKEVLLSTMLSSLLTIRVLRPLGPRWFTSTGRDGGRRCPKVTCYKRRIFQETCPNQLHTPLIKQKVAVPDLWVLQIKENHSECWSCWTLESPIQHSMHSLSLPIKPPIPLWRPHPCDLI